MENFSRYRVLFDYVLNCKVKEPNWYLLDLMLIGNYVILHNQNFPNVKQSQCMTIRRIDCFPNFIKFSNYNFFIIMWGGKVFPGGFHKIRSMNPISFPARCLIVKLIGNNQSPLLFYLLWYVLFPWFVESAESRALWSVITWKYDP